MSDRYWPIFIKQYLDYEKGIIGLLPKDAMIELIKRFTGMISKEPIELNIKYDGNPVVIVGDIHGSFESLLQVYRIPLYKNMKTRFIFLGDYVDRGENSTEVLTFIMLMKLFFPRKFYFLRGNHENSEVNSYYGFTKECCTKYDKKVFDLIVKSYDYYSVTCLLEDVFCVHGCVTQYLTDYKKLIKSSKPLKSDNKVLNDLLWSDPLEKGSYNRFSSIQSVRGIGFLYGKKVIDTFCEFKNVNYICRAHQCKMDGFEWSPDGKLITIFSSANYCNCNRAGLLFIHEEKNNPYYVLNPLCFVLPSGIDNSTSIGSSTNSQITKSEQKSTVEINDSEETGITQLYRHQTDVRI